MAVRGNRVALHLVLRQLDMSRIDDPDTDWEAELTTVSEKTDQLLDLMIRAVEREYPGNYITSLFKNAGRCQHLVGVIAAEIVDEQSRP